MVGPMVRRKVGCSVVEMVARMVKTKVEWRVVEMVVQKAWSWDVW